MNKRSTPKSKAAKSQSPRKPRRRAPSKAEATPRVKKTGSHLRGAEPPASVTPTAAQLRSRRESLAVAQAAIQAALDKKALLPVLIDVSGLASYTDFIGVVSGRSDRQVDAISEHVTHVMEERGRRLLGREGTRNGRWALLDFGDVVLHVFYHPVREVFDIESLWIDAPRVKLKVPEEAMVAPSEVLPVGP